MGLLLGIFGLIWPLLVPLELMSKFVAANPDSPIVPFFKMIFEAIGNLLQ